MVALLLAQADANSPAEFIKLLLGSGGLGSLAFLIYLLLGRKVITRGELDRQIADALAGVSEANKRTELMKVERDEWKNAALQLMRNSEKTTGAMEKVADAVTKSA